MDATAAVIVHEAVTSKTAFLCEYEVGSVEEKMGKIQTHVFFSMQFVYIVAVCPCRLMLLQKLNTFEALSLTF